MWFLGSILLIKSDGKDVAPSPAAGVSPEASTNLRKSHGTEDTHYFVTLNKDPEITKSSVSTFVNYGRVEE